MFFFFNDTATTEIYTLSLHDALPIWKEVDWQTALEYVANGLRQIKNDHGASAIGSLVSPHSTRSEEHTSELQSQSNLVCRLLLEKKKKTNIRKRSELSIESSESRYKY